MTTDTIPEASVDCTFEASLPFHIKLAATAKLEAKKKIADSGCWEWTGSTVPRGYGQIYFAGIKGRVHRVAYAAYVGPIPKGMGVCHKCDNPKCFNPEHLFVGTQTDNNRDKALKGRARNGENEKTHCPQGHPYSGDNLYVVPGSKHRLCRTCYIIRGKKRRQQKKEVA